MSLNKPHWYSAADARDDERHEEDRDSRAERLRERDRDDDLARGARRIRIGVSSGYRGVSGARYYLHLNPKSRSVSSHAAVGCAVPARAFHRRVMSIALSPSVVVSELRATLREPGTQAVIAAILDLYQGEQWDGSNRVGQWPTDEWGAPTDELEGLVHQLTEILKQVPSYIEASDLFAGGGLDWFLFHDYADLDTMVQTLVDEGRHDGFFLDASDLHGVLKSWLEMAVIELLDREYEDDDTISDEEQKDLALGRLLLGA